MALFINVDPVPPRWYSRRVYRGWQFGYSGGTKNDFMIDVEVARWRFVCYIGFKYPRNPSLRQERHEKWQKEQELARERANKPEPTVKRLWRSLRRAEASGYRMDSQQPKDHRPSPYARLVLATKHLLRFGFVAYDNYDEGRRKLAARASVPEPVHGNAAAPIERVVLHEEHQRAAPDHSHHKDPEAGELPKEPNA